MPWDNLKFNKRVDHTNSIIRPQALVDWDQFRKSRFLLCRLSPKLLLIVKNGVPDVFPSGQCIKRCMTKDNADVTDRQQQMFASCQSFINRFRFLTASFLVVTDWWVVIRTKPVSVYRSLWSDGRISMIKPFVKL